MREENGTKQALLTPTGDIVASMVADLRAQLKTAAEQGAQRVTIDLARVQIVDSTGIGLLIAAYNTLQKAGGKIALINASRDLVLLFKSMRLDQRFEIGGA